VGAGSGDPRTAVRAELVRTLVSWDGFEIRPTGEELSDVGECQGASASADEWSAAKEVMDKTPREEASGFGPAAKSVIPGFRACPIAAGQRCEDDSCTDERKANGGSHSAEEITCTRQTKATEAAGSKTWQHLPVEGRPANTKIIRWGKPALNATLK
jgi:hypothetical protein